MWDQYWTDRGFPWEHDPGPPRNRSWLRLFATTPNYRGLRKAVTGREAFRWHFGPMFYRGRLRDHQVKVLIVGQEGAQDESLAHRSFAGGTGARMQHLLTHIGITHSYLFLNTFVYPIFGQYDGKLPELAQHPVSPIARHRNELFDYALERNDIRLVIAVGNAAKESIATWIRSRGGTANPESLHTPDHHVLAPRVRALRMLHPGSQSAELEFWDKDSFSSDDLLGRVLIRRSEDGFVVTAGQSASDLGGGCYRLTGEQGDYRIWLEIREE